jgi:Fe-S-cluster containining protein
VGGENTGHGSRVTRYDIDPLFYNQTEKIYKEVDKHLPVHKENPCKGCNICCTSSASQGATTLEFDYMKEYLIKSGRSPEEMEQFKDYVNKLKDPSTSKLLYNKCPFYNLTEKYCTIYPARPLSCRTFGYFIKDGRLHLIPDRCFLKKNIKIYTDITFVSLLPFALPFYEIVYAYEEFLKGNA